MYRPDPNNFKAVEYFPPERVKRWGVNAWFITPEIFVFTLQQLRDRFGRMVINRPSIGQTQRGMRTAQFHINQIGKSSPTQSELLDAYRKYDASDSLHRYAMAADVTFLDVTLEYVHQYIKDNPDEFPFISFIETGITWFHFDCRNQEGITFWNLNTGKIEEVIPQKPVRWGEFMKWHAGEVSGKTLDQYTDAELINELSRRLGLK